MGLTLAQELDLILERLSTETTEQLSVGDQLMIPGHRERVRPTNTDLAEIIRRLSRIQRDSNYPVQVVYGDFDEWLLGTGAKSDTQEQVYITTDGVRGSELHGSAEDDAKAWVYLRNLVPVILAALIELGVRRAQSD